MEKTVALHGNDTVIDEKALQNASAVLALLHGKSDSICRLFRKEISVNRAELKTLNDLMIQKLALHTVGAVTTTIDMTFANKRILTFKSWTDFEAYNFDIENAATKSVFIQWDFFACFSSYKVPQRHTVSVRIASTPKPSDLFKALIGGGFDEDEDFEIKSCTMICKVDFVNNTLAEELVNIVERWEEQAEDACSKNGKFKCFLAQHRTGFALAFEYMLLSSLALALAVIWKFGISRGIVSNTNTEIIYLLVALIPLTVIIQNIAHGGGKRIYERFSNLLQTHIFTISKGDSKAQERIKESTKFGKELWMFIINALFSIALSIVFFLLE